MNKYTASKTYQEKYTQITLSKIITELVICSRNRVSRSRFQKFLTQFQIRAITTRFSTAIVQNTTNIGLYLHLLTTLNSIVALMYFRLHIHKLRRSITRRAVVSATTSIISCDARHLKLWFSLLT